jgi:succinate dehydrogenase / fumarate reductase cytochrome b subunit
MSTLPGGAERAERGPVRRKGAGPAFTGWVDPRGRSLEGRAFALNRIAGIGLVVYLYLHLGVLSILLAGASAWSDVLQVATSRTFLVFDVILFFGLLFHGLNGLRVGFVGSGYLVRRQRALLWAAMALVAVALAYGIFHIVGGA